MKQFIIHGKILPIPSFFQVYNFGGGRGDKDREIVYAELSHNTPALVNYYYINNEYQHLFQSSLFDNVTERFNHVGDLYNHIRNTLRDNGELYRNYESPSYDFKEKIFLLDSGAYNIIKYIAGSVDYNIERFKMALREHIYRYYTFAEQLKFDLVVGFDMGGKYTLKDGENDNVELITFLNNLDKNEIHDLMNRITVDFLKENKSYHPKFLATIHGETPNELLSNTKKILDLERNAGISFWGFAIGGIASSKQLNEEWFKNINFKKTGVRIYKDAVAPARAAKIVRSLVGDRAIHLLGCGSFTNIPLNYYNGATSFDAASPVRRVGDGNLESTRIVFDPRPSTVAFSKYFIGGFNSDNSMRVEECTYEKLNVVPNEMALCGCNACDIAGSVHNIKHLYSLKEQDGEANYFSRQLIGLHAVNQHKQISEIVANFTSIIDFAAKYPSKLYKGLKYINEQIK